LRIHHLARFHKGGTAAIAMRSVTDLKELGIVDEIIAEPERRRPSDTMPPQKIFGDTLERQLLILSNQGIKDSSTPATRSSAHVPILRPRRVIITPSLSSVVAPASCRQAFRNI